MVARLKHPDRIGRYNIVVCGGGPAGIAAAFSAARPGVSVLIVESCGFLGGTATSGLPLLTFHDLSGNVVVAGFAQRFVDELMKNHGSPGHIYLKNGHMTSLTPVDPETVKLVSQEMLVDRGVTILLHSLIVDVIRKGSRIEGDEGFCRSNADLEISGRYRLSAPLHS